MQHTWQLSGFISSERDFPPAKRTALKPSIVSFHCGKKNNKYVNLSGTHWGKERMVEDESEKQLVRDHVEPCGQTRWWPP